MGTGEKAPGLDALIQCLTPREKEVFFYITRGLPNKVAAAELGVSQRTIEAHRARIFRKMNVRNATELARSVFTQVNPQMCDSAQVEYQQGKQGQDETGPRA